ncbi:MAG: AsmA family protein [Gammaproteobacteria bacterium]|nr:AsmA family protein [Gammaproteobacteria bacterium]
MKIILKTIGYLIGLVILLYIIAAIILAFFISPKTYNHIVNKYAYDVTGHHISIKGNTHISIFPSLTVKLNDVTVQNDKPFQQYGDLAKIGNLQVKIAIWPLIGGAIKPDLFILKNAKINLVTNSKHQKNWHPQANQSQHSKKHLNRTHFSGRDIAIPKIQIENGTINIINLTTNKKTRLNKLNLYVNPNTALDGFDIKFNTIYSSNDQKPLPITFATYLSTTDNQMKLDDLMVGINKLTFNGVLNINVNKHVVKGNLLGKLANGSLSDSFTLTNTASQPKINMALKLSQMDLKPVLSALLNRNNITGTLNFQSQLSTSGSLKQQWLSNMSGRGSINIQNGQIGGVDMINTVQQGMQLSNQGKKPMLQRGVTVFKKIFASFDIRNGTLSNQDLQIDSDNLVVTGNGTIDLPSQRLHFDLNMKHPNKKDWQLPLTLTGTLQHTKVQLNIKAIAYKLLKNKVTNAFKNLFGK